MTRKVRGRGRRTRRPRPGALGASAHRGHYQGETSQHRLLQFSASRTGLIGLYVGLREACSFGGTYETTTQTTPRDRFYVRPDGSFLVKGSFWSDPSGDPFAAHRAQRLRAYFAMAGVVSGGRVIGWVSEADVAYRDGHQIGGCQTTPITFAVGRG